MKTSCKYTYTNQFGATHRWVVSSATMAVELNIRAAVGGEPRGGLEIHSTVPLGDEHDAPHHMFCECVAYRPCWHTGSSMYATEHWIPVWKVIQSDHEEMFRLLTAELGRCLREYGRRP